MTLLLPAVASGMPQLDTVYCCDALTMLKAMPCNSVDCVVTSPPYYGLRDYGVDGQIGLEQTPREFIDKLVKIFDEVRRVLKPSGTLWLNIGDSYANDDKWGGYATNMQAYMGDAINNARIKRTTGLKPKDLLMIPARVAIALQDDGWWLRSEIIWSKPNPMPESVKDRPTKAHEMVYLLTKAPSYWYDADAIREQANYGENCATFRGGGTYTNSRSFNNSIKFETDGEVRERPKILDRNARSVWTIPTEPTPFAHFATFPTKLVERCIRAGCPAQVCVECGKPYRSEVEIEQIEAREWSPSINGKGLALDNQHAHKRIRGNMERYRAAGGDHDNPFPKRTVTGFKPTCTCNADTRPGIVLDPFGGSGTVGLVAREWGRRFLLCDLNPEYVNLARSRLAVAYTPPLPMFA